LQLRVLLQDLRQAEVHHDGPEASRGVGVGHQHDVLGLEIAVEDLQPMRMPEAPADLNQQRDPEVSPGVASRVQVGLFWSKRDTGGG